MNYDIAMDLLFGGVFATGGSLLAFNVARARDRYTSFSSRAWGRRSPMAQPKFVTAYGFMFLAGGVLLLLVAFLRLLRG